MCSALCLGPKWIMSFIPHLLLEQLKGLGWVTEGGLAASSGLGWGEGTASFCLVWTSAELSTPGVPKHANQAAWLTSQKGASQRLQTPSLGDSGIQAPQDQGAKTPALPSLCLPPGLSVLAALALEPCICLPPLLRGWGRLYVV